MSPAEQDPPIERDGPAGHTEPGRGAPTGHEEPTGHEASVRCMALLARGSPQEREQALADLYRRWNRPLFRFLYGMCQDRTLCEDLLQEVFVRVWRAAPRYEPTAKFSTWLFHVARNHWLNEREKRLHRIRPVSLDRPSGDEEGPSIDAADPSAPTPLKAVESKELGLRIRSAVGKLPEKLRETWVLAIDQGLPYPQVGEILGIPVGTVKSRMFQAVRSMREDLSPYAAADAPAPAADRPGGSADDLR